MLVVTHVGEGVSILNASHAAFSGLLLDAAIVVTVNSGASVLKLKNLHPRVKGALQTHEL